MVVIKGIMESSERRRGLGFEFEEKHINFRMIEGSDADLEEKHIVREEFIMEIPHEGKNITDIEVYKFKKGIFEVEVKEKYELEFEDKDLGKMEREDEIIVEISENGFNLKYWKHKLVSLSNLKLILYKDNEKIYSSTEEGKLEGKKAEEKIMREFKERYKTLFNFLTF